MPMPMVLSGPTTEPIQPVPISKVNLLLLCEIAIGVIDIGPWVSGPHDSSPLLL